jgi:S-(hydroxymethyl)glutathione dehydrogenase/alcohol dehydrogenase
VKAAVCRAFGEPLSIEEVELREPAAGEVSVRVRACAICHSDVALVQGAWGGELPAVYGHEAAGIVEEVGAGVRSVAPGDHVVVTLIRACGHCAQCLRGQPALCEQLAEFPLTRSSPLTDGEGRSIQQGVRTAAFAERVTVDASQVVPVPADVPLECASLLACGVVTGVGAVVNTARVEPGSSVVVFGAGGVGLNVVQGAALAGAGQIVAVDLLDGKLEAALRFGATSTLNAARADVVGEVLELTRGRGADYAFDATGSTAAVEQAALLVRPAGTVVLVGMPPSGARVSFEAEDVAERALRLLGSKMGSARPQLDIPRLVQLYLQGRLLLDELITRRWPLQEINEALAAAERGEVLRALLTA